MKINELRLKNRDLYLVVEYNLFDDETTFLDFIATELENGAQIVQLNTTNKSTKENINTGKKIRELCSIYNALLIVSDRIDIAQTIEADGIFLDKNSFDVDTARELLGENIIIGTNYLTNNIDYIITETAPQDKMDFPCFARISTQENTNKKIIYKKFEENT